MSFASLTKFYLKSYLIPIETDYIKTIYYFYVQFSTFSDCYNQTIRGFVIAAETHSAHSSVRTRPTYPGQ